MWVLLIAVIADGLINIQFIQKYPNDLDPCQSRDECHTVCESELKRIATELKLAYPGDTDYSLVCKLVVRKGV